MQTLNFDKKKKKKIFSIFIDSIVFLCIIIMALSIIYFSNLISENINKENNLEVEYDSNKDYKFYQERKEIERIGNMSEQEFIQETMIRSLYNEARKNKLTISCLPDYNIPLSDDVLVFIAEMGLYYDISYELILSLIKLESNFDKSIRSITNDVGLMQLNQSGTSQWLGELLEIENFDPYNYKHNIEAGVFYLDFLRDYWYNKGITDNETLIYYVLGSYNMGINGFSNFVMHNHYKTWAYSNIIIDYKKQLEKEGSF